MKICDQLDRLAHAVRALETAGCRVIEARACSHALPTVLLATDTPCPPTFVVGEPLIESLFGVQHFTVETTLGVCVTGCLR